MITHHCKEELEKIAKDWYTTQRGRIVGNTRAWEDLSQDEKLNIMDSVLEVLEYMEEAWQWKS